MIGSKPVSIDSQSDNFEIQYYNNNTAGNPLVLTGTMNGGTLTASQNRNGYSLTATADVAVVAHNDNGSTTYIITLGKNNLTLAANSIQWITTPSAKDLLAKANANADGIDYVLIRRSGNISVRKEAFAIFAAKPLRVDNIEPVPCS